MAKVGVLPSMTPLSSRRQMLRRISTGFGMLALQGLAGARESGAMFRPRAKSVIFCYMSGGVSHVDSFDPKPELRRRHGQPMPVPVQRTVFNDNGNIMGSPWESRRYGQSGMELTNLFPQIARMADELAVIRSMTSKVSEHAQGNYAFHTGFPIAGNPSAGAWVSYGLGSANENLPGFVVLQSGGAVPPHGGVGLYGSGFLPAQHQASILRVDQEFALPNIRPGEEADKQRRRLDFVRGLDASLGDDPQVEAAIRNYETAYRMQTAVPELCDIRGETEATRALYALDDPDKQPAAYCRQCLVARRLVERGVRFVELSCINESIGLGNAANPWDQHGQIEKGHGAMAHQVDRPIAGLLRDLKSRGLLDSTLVIFSGEFGRTPFSQGSDGRDHNPYGFSLWLAGGGIKGGTVVGATDDLGYYAVEKPLQVYDLYATVLHQLGLDHEKLTFRHGGRDLRLTDVHGKVIREIVA
jgi:Protein of unknown function (DUF1501)